MRALAVLTILLGSLIAPAVASAQQAQQPITFTLHFDSDPETGLAGPPGSLLEVGAVTVPNLLALAQVVDCDVTIDAVNNESTRQGTDIVLTTSGGQELVLEDVEAVPGDPGPRTFGRLLRLLALQRIVASVRFGPQGEASISADITFACVPEVPPPGPPQVVPPVPPPPVLVPPRLTG